MLLQIVRKAPLIWMLYLLFVFMSTEAMSAFNAISSVTIRLLYTASLLGVTILVIYSKLWKNGSKTPSVSLKPLDTMLLTGVLIILFFTLFTALYFPPNNWDSMTYHMARVAHWAQNSNVAFYPTHIGRQLFNPPLAEYTILHLYLLTGTDFFSNMVQYTSFICTLVVIANTIQFFGGRSTTQLFGVLLGSTLPQAILQASNTKPEFTMTFLCCISAYYSLIYFDYNRMKFLIFAAIAFGLALLAKASALIFVAPILGMLCLQQLVKGKLRVLVPYIVFFCTLALLLNTLHWYRNYEAFGSIQGPVSNTAYQIDQAFNSKLMLSSVVKHSTLHISGSFYINHWFSDLIIDNFSEAVTRLHRVLKIDINDPNNSLAGTYFGFNKFANLDEDYAGNALVFLLFVIILIVFPFKLKHAKNLTFVYFSIGVISSYFLVCIILKFSPWHSRLHLPFFMFVTISIAMFLDEYKKWLIGTIALVSFALAIPYLVIGTPRSIFKDKKLCINWKRDEWMFAKKGWQPLGELYQISDTINKYHIKRIGLVMGTDDWDYPIFKVLKRKNRDLHLFHIQVPEWETPMVIQNKFPKNDVEMIIKCNVSKYITVQK